MKRSSQPHTPQPQPGHRPGYPKGPEIVPRVPKPENPSQDVPEFSPRRTEPEVVPGISLPEIGPEKSPQIHPDENPSEVPTE